ncbi:hypothetical protein Dtox_2034 [Desulfofarcimen acetoxidans DSM 771]|uniref:Uncharacterized protein n=1 Tax=Desulfofarcimen acetoxidans (strain ATCC 49208 / DSM 771 / KCTC 5769 / VKM B-1644 / 5575) TaxID=485916 RepID=C8VYI6_DESAS|nr:hypothetical protein [Desulfofarcimen acetoxidans]ACV62867.1 hypothetical protein Dtox_2034 [Desulfofarcimen acetoxidans DSM 771]
MIKMLFMSSLTGSVVSLFLILFKTGLAGVYELACHYEQMNKNSFLKN